MNWNLLFGLLFIVFVALTVAYANKNMVLYNKTTTEDVNKVSKDESGASSTYSHPQQVTRTYHDNYASIGGAIGFGIIAAASLIAFAITVKKANS